MQVTAPAASESTPRLLNVAQVAERLNLGVRTVHRHMSDGTLPAGLKLGGRRLMNEAELNAFIAGGCKPVTPPATTH